TAENMKKLYQAYQEIWDLINKKDSNGLKAKTKIAFSEYDKAEGYKEGTWYKTFGFDEWIYGESVKEYKMRPINSNNYEIYIDLKGRIVQLEDKGGYSPLIAEAPNGEVQHYSPYFSLIDNKIIITR